jgi:hypothetical protein
MNNKEEQAGMLGPASILLIQMHKGFEAPLENLTTGSACSTNLL